MEAFDKANGRLNRLSKTFYASDWPIFALLIVHINVRLCHSTFKGDWIWHVAKIYMTLCTYTITIKLTWFQVLHRSLALFLRYEAFCGRTVEVLSYWRNYDVAKRTQVESPYTTRIHWVWTMFGGDLQSNKMSEQLDAKTASVQAVSSFFNIALERLVCNGQK